jgi:hypothetical protein
MTSQSMYYALLDLCQELVSLTRISTIKQKTINTTVSYVNNKKHSWQSKDD